MSRQLTYRRKMSLLLLETFGDRLALGGAAAAVVVDSWLVQRDV